MDQLIVRLGKLVQMLLMLLVKRMNQLLRHQGLKTERDAAGPTCARGYSTTVTTVGGVIGYGTARAAEMETTESNYFADSYTYVSFAYSSTKSTLYLCC
jgi:hypothetical protein